MDVRQALKALQAMASIPRGGMAPVPQRIPQLDAQPSFSGAPSSNFAPYQGGPINTAAPAQQIMRPENFSTMQLVRQSYAQPQYANNTSQDYQGML